jgi:hypothetical protein
MTGRKGETAIDSWSFAHFAAGLALGASPLGYWTALVVVVGYEGLEGVLRRVKVQDGGLFEYESWPNIGADIVLGMLGFAILHHFVAPLIPWPWRLP